MLSEKELRGVILKYSTTVDPMGEVGRAYVDGTLRGLLWTLTGKDPGPYLGEDMKNVLTLAGVEFTEKEGRLYFELPGH